MKFIVYIRFLIFSNIYLSFLTSILMNVNSSILVKKFKRVNINLDLGSLIGEINENINYHYKFDLNDNKLIIKHSIPIEAENVKVKIYSKNNNYEILKYKSEENSDSSNDKSNEKMNLVINLDKSYLTNNYDKDLKLIYSYTLKDVTYNVENENIIKNIEKLIDPNLMITTFEIDVNGINSYEKLNEKVVKNRIKYKKRIINKEDPLNELVVNYHLKNRKIVFSLRKESLNESTNFEILINKKLLKVKKLKTNLFEKNTNSIEANKSFMSKEIIIKNYNKEFFSRVFISIMGFSILLFVIQYILTLIFIKK